MSGKLLKLNDLEFTRSDLPTLIQWGEPGEKNVAEIPSLVSWITAEDYFYQDGIYQDKSGSKNDFFQYTPEHRPALGTLYDRSALVFDDATTHIEGPNVMPMGDFTVVCVCQVPSGGGHVIRSIAGSNSGSTDSHSWRLQTYAEQASTFVITGSTTWISIPTDEPILLIASANTVEQSIKCSVNGEVPEIRTDFTAINNDPTIQLGAYRLDTEYNFDGSVGDILFFAEDLFVNTEAYNVVIDTLKNKYNIR